MIIFVLLLMFKTTNHAKGQVFILYTVLYSVARFFLEYLRGDYGALLFGLKSAQLTSLSVIIIGIILFIWCGLGKAPHEQIKKPSGNQKKR